MERKEILKKLPSKSGATGRAGCISFFPVLASLHGRKWNDQLCAAG